MPRRNRMARGARDLPTVALQGLELDGLLVLADPE
jgi:hypothetical protein